MITKNDVLKAIELFESGNLRENKTDIYDMIQECTNEYETYELFE